MWAVRLLVSLFLLLCVCVPFFLFFFVAVLGGSGVIVVVGGGGGGVNYSIRVPFGDIGGERGSLSATVFC